MKDVFESKTELNAQIKSMMHEIIKSRGLDGKIAMMPIENGCKNRLPCYYDHQDKIYRFTVHMWNINRLPKEKWYDELVHRLDKAIDEFKEKGIEFKRCPFIY